MKMRNDSFHICSVQCAICKILYQARAVSRRGKRGRDIDKLRGHFHLCLAVTVQWSGLGVSAEKQEDIPQTNK